MSAPDHPCALCGDFFVPAPGGRGMALPGVAGGFVCSPCRAERTGAIHLRRPGLAADQGGQPLQVVVVVQQQRPGQPGVVGGHGGRQDSQAGDGGKMFNQRVDYSISLI